MVCSCQHLQIGLAKVRLCRFTRYVPDDLAETMYDEGGRSLKPEPLWSCDSPGKINIWKRGNGTCPTVSDATEYELI